MQREDSMKQPGTIVTTSSSRQQESSFLQVDCCPFFKCYLRTQILYKANILKTYLSYGYCRNDTEAPKNIGLQYTAI